MSKASGCLAGRSRRRICDMMLRCILPRRVVRAAQGTGPRARRLQDIESDMGYDGIVKVNRLEPGRKAS